MLSSPRRGKFLCDAMGIGKSAQAVGISNCLCPQSLLVICPASLKINWQREFEKFDFWGITPELTSPKKSSDSPYLVTNYDVVHRLDLKTPELLILDESHYIKSPKARRSKAVLALCKAVRANGGTVMLLTGTPSENRPVELWHQLVCLGWIPEDSYESFTERYCDRKLDRIYMAKRPKKSWGVKYDATRKRWYREVWNVNGASNIPELRQKLLKAGMVRRLKNEVLKELPPKTHQVIELPRLKQWRSTLLQEVFGELPPSKRGESQVKYFDRLEDIANKNGDRKKLVDTYAEARKLDGVEKLKQAIDFIKDTLETEEKAVVFAWHREVLDGLVNGLKEYNPVKIDGATATAQRQNAVDSFQEDPTTRVFVGQIKAAGTGITLTAASHVIFAEFSWSPGEMEQAADRCHRNGQKDNVLVQYLVFEESTDQRVAYSLIEKQKTLGALLDGKEE